MCCLYARMHACCMEKTARKTARKREREREFSGNSVDRSMEENKEERRRKRRSRWGDADNKVVSVADMNNVSVHKRDSGLSQPGIAIPGQIGQPAVIIPSSKVQHTKAKNPMLTKISRNDPALIQYARQTFGTLDLVEEQWKKAEDHYKVRALSFVYRYECRGGGRVRRYIEKI